MKSVKTAAAPRSWFGRNAGLRPRLVLIVGIAMLAPGVLAVLQAISSYNSSMRILEQAINVARRFKPFDDAERQALLEKTRPPGEAGKFQAFKTSDRFDATSKNPHWLTGGTI